MVQIQRYGQVLTVFWSTAIAAELEYRLNFLLAILTSMVNLLGSIFGLFLFYRTGYTFSGWRWEEAMIILGVFTLMQGIADTFLIPNLNKIVSLVQQGTLDFVLLKPIGSQFWLSTRAVSPWGLPDLFLALILITYAGTRLNLPWQGYLLSLLPLSCGIISLYSLWFMLGATSIWFVKIYNVTEVLQGLLEAGRFPLSAYPAAYRFFFTFIIPVAFLTTVPAEAMLGRVSSLWLVGTIVLAIGLLWLSDRFWKLALRFYTSASS